MLQSKRTEPVFDTAAVVGVGLIGGSLGMAAKKRGLAGRVLGIGRSEQKLMRAKLLGAIDEYSLDTENGAADADLVVICTPVRTIVPTLERMSASLKEGAVVTDVGSTKQEIVRDAAEVIPEGRHFIGGHPMAGSEQAGVENASADLFVDATYVLTPSENTDVTALGKLVSFTEGLGARVEIMSAAEHDKAVAIISHLPHAIAAALLHLAADSQRKSGSVFKLAAGSFRDLTRISDSPPQIWTDICSTNAEAIIDAVRAFLDALDPLLSALADVDDAGVSKFFEEAREIRRTYLRIAK